MEKLADGMKKPKKNHKNQRELEDKWGGGVVDKGWVAIPKVLIQNQHRLELTPLELNVLLVLLSEWWGNKSNVIPSIGRIADFIGKSSRSVSSAIKSLAEKELKDKTLQKKLSEKGFKGLIEVTPRSKAGNKTSNSYTFQGLYWSLNVIASEKTGPSKEEQAIDESFEQLKKDAAKLYEQDLRR